MKASIILSCVIGLAATAAFAQADVIKARQEAMKATGAKTADVGKMLKREDKFDIEKEKAALNQYVMVSEKGPAMFPAGSQNGDTAALPAVWTDRAEVGKGLAQPRAPAQTPPGAAAQEAQLLSRLSPPPHAARAWAELAQTLSARARRGKAVNLDPAALLMDILLKIDETAGSLAQR